jgi:exopolysaccharide biosynthesis predicted pyruvyltransferase EpsI
MQACPDARFCHDMAFFLDLIDSPPVKNSGYFFREDGEAPSTKPQLPPAETNRDLSKFGRAQYPVDGFIRTIASYREIHTNRLHIGIAAALLGRQTYLSGNNYFKIRAIYKSSMEGTYPSVKFSDA